MDISYNEFKVLQADLSGLTALEVFDCSFNKLLTTMPSLVALKFFNVKNTKLNVKLLQEKGTIPLSCSVLM
jgi:Leucine-rich repeat (LRR) protein